MKYNNNKSSKKYNNKSSKKYNKKSSKKYNKKSSKKYNKKSSKKYNKKYTKKFSKKYTKKFSKKGRGDFLNISRAQHTPSSASAASIQQEERWGPEVPALMEMGFSNEEDIRLALYHSNNDVDTAANILFNLPRLIKMGFTKENSIVALSVSKNDVNKAANMLTDTPGSIRNFTNDEADDFLARVEIYIVPIHANMRDNVKKYLVGKYEQKDYTSMFGSPMENKYGLGIFYENFIDNMRSKRNTSISYEYNGIRFANNNGPNFRNHRREALEMFRMVYDELKKF